MPDSLPWLRFGAAVESGRLKLRVPGTESLRRAEEASREMGDALLLSDVDLQVLALALEQEAAGNRPTIATDDYSIQNVAHRLGLPFTPLATFGIRLRLRWVRYCPACRRKYPPDYQDRLCRVCGTELKRKPMRKSPVH